MSTKAIPKVEPGPLSANVSLKSKSRQFRRALMRWADRYGRSFPWRQTRDPFGTLVAEVMLQRTRSEQVARVYDRFLARFANVSSLAKARVGEVESVIRPLGLVSRAKTLVKIARAIMEKYDGRIPVKAEEAILLPGTGPYAASALDVFLNRRRLPLVDANIARVLSRVFAIGQPDWRYATADERRALYELAALCLGKADPRRYHYAILDFGAKVCSATSPSCPECPMHRVGICAYCQDASRSRLLDTSPRHQVAGNLREQSKGHSKSGLRKRALLGH